jgi:hypothetical protein
MCFGLRLGVLLVPPSFGGICLWQDVLGLSRALFTTAEVSLSTCLEKQHLCYRLTELRRANIAFHIEALAAVLEGVPIVLPCRWRTCGKCLGRPLGHLAVFTSAECCWKRCCLELVSLSSAIAPARAWRAAAREQGCDSGVLGMVTGAGIFVAHNRLEPIILDSAISGK